MTVRVPVHLPLLGSPEPRGWAGFLGADMRAARRTSPPVVRMHLHAVCWATMWHALDASGAMTTRPAGARRAAGWPARGTTRGAASGVPGAIAGFCTVSSLHSTYSGR